MDFPAQEINLAKFETEDLASTQATSYRKVGDRLVSFPINGLDGQT